MGNVKSIRDRFRANEDRREKIKKLLAYCAIPKDGDRRSWVEVETDTGISMSVRGVGRDLFRIAMNQLGREYIALPGDGIEFSSPVNATEILDRKCKSIAHAITRAQVAVGNLDRHLLEMPEGERKQKYIADKCLLGTLNLSSSLTKKLNK